MSGDCSVRYDGEGRHCDSGITEAARGNCLAAGDGSDHGRLSAVARHVVIALRDSSIRRELADSLRSPSGHAMIDLSTCGKQSLGRRMFDRGEFFGAGSASSICAIATRGRAVLYIDHALLAGWDSRTIPLVTAVEQPHITPDSVLAYRSPDRTIRIPAHDLTKIGPVLVVVSLADPATAHSTPKSVHLSGAAFRASGSTR